LALDGIDVILVPTFTEVTIGEDVRTALHMMVEPRQNGVEGALAPKVA
jgi:stage V sporulation protein SpoVS